MLQHFYEDFLDKVPRQLLQLLDTIRMEDSKFYGDFVLLTFVADEPYDLEEVMDMFEDDIELITLYHHIPSKTSSFGHSTCAYSNPAFGQMFKMNAQTLSDGKVHNIHVTIYHSLEMMYGDLLLDSTLHSREGEFKYLRRKEDVMMVSYENESVSTNGFHHQ